MDISQFISPKSPKSFHILKNQEQLWRYFLLSEFSFVNIHDSRDSKERGGYFFSSSIPFPPASKPLRHQSGDYCKELTSAHDSNRDPQLFERKSQTTKKPTKFVFIVELPAFRVLISQQKTASWLFSLKHCEMLWSSEQLYCRTTVE